VKILYKKDTKGNPRILNMWTEGDLLVQETGLVDGKKVTNKSLCKPKNTGKKNATTGPEQAIKEMESKFTKKLREGYFLTLSEAMNVQVTKPMLAKSYKDHADKIDWTNCHIQPKLDGMRAILRSDLPINRLFSRTNKEIDTMDHITKDLSNMTYLIDGELYAAGQSFQDNMKLIKKYRPGETEDVKWYVYDLVSDDPFIKRYEILQDLVSTLDKTNKDHNLQLVPTYKVTTFDEVLKYHAKFLEQGYEGTMIRHGDSSYKLNGKSDSLLKFKDFIDRTATLLDIIPEERRPTMGKALCNMINDEGNTVEFTASFKASHEERADYLKNKEDYIGETVELRFFEWTLDGIPRFPVAYGFRLDK